MKDQSQSYRTRIDGANAPRTCSEHAGADGADVGRTRAERVAAEAEDARNARGEQIGADQPDAPCDRPPDKVRDRSLDSARDSARDSAQDGLRDDARDARIAAERRLLAALCQGSIGFAARDEVQRRLREHAFGDPEHELIFRALAKIPAGEAEFVRAALGLRLTRAGFPEFDLGPLFDTAAPDASEIAELLRELNSL